MPQPRTPAGDRPGFARFLPALIAATILAAGALLPRGRPLGDVDLCAIKAATGVACPSCGITRSVVELAHGHLAESLAFHPLGPALCGALLAMLAYPFLPAGARARMFALTRGTSAAVACVAVIIATWLVRLWLGAIPE